MKDRNNTLVSIRNETIGFISNESSLEELFQNRTLRPILKFQNDLFLNIFINYAVKQKKVFFILSPEKKLHYIENVIQRDIKFRNLLKGTIIAYLQSKNTKIILKTLLT
jgi:hypothetical protein